MNKRNVYNVDGKPTIYLSDGVPTPTENYELTNKYGKLTLLDKPKNGKRGELFQIIDNTDEVVTA